MIKNLLNTFFSQLAERRIAILSTISRGALPFCCLFLTLLIYAPVISKDHSDVIPGSSFTMVDRADTHFKDPAWTGKGAYRILVKAPPFKLSNGRDHDEMPASYPIDFVKMLEEKKINGKVNLASIQVHQYNPLTGAAKRFSANGYAVSPYDRPCRFDDHDLPEDYPSRIGYASTYESGRPPITITKRKGRLFDLETENTIGQIIWVHTQQGNESSYYAIYFDVVPINAKTGHSPAPWIGDVDVLRKKEGMGLGSLPHFTIAAGDLNGDGLFDLVASAEKGDVMWYPNRGTLENPEFIGCHMLTDEQGPIDVGWYGAPFLFDWNNDGLLDLLIGTSHNVILWWKNVGTHSQFQFKYMGFVQADGKRLEVPQSPVPEDTKNIFANDYYNQPWIGDWDGDGLPDILTGGYTTGLIFYYHCTGRDADGVPLLKYVDPLTADGKVIDATWAASPTAYDFNGDGKKELLTGSWWWSGIPYPPKVGEADFMMYYENTGTRYQPNLQRIPFPGPQQGRGIARATVVDWNHDGLPDLIIDAVVYINEGSKDHPKWPQKGNKILIPWGVYSPSGIVNNMVDMDGDGIVDASVDIGGGFYSVGGTPYAPTQKKRGNAKTGGKQIVHKGPGYGDDYQFTFMRDWDKDGRADLLWGTHQGNIYLHRNLGGNDPFDFAKGVKLKLTTGEDLQVGPKVVDDPKKATDFTILQGSRIRFIADDFDGDGIDDLAVTDTYGNVWIFLNTRVGGVNTLLPGIKVAKFSGFVWGFDPIEWNGDGKKDIISEGSTFEPGQLLINTSRPGLPSFSKPFRPKELQRLPFVFWGPGFRGVDWNGDGDDDLLIQSEFYYFFWAERSFLEHGYCKGEEVEGVQRKKS